MRAGFAAKPLTIAYRYLNDGRSYRYRRCIWSYYINPGGHHPNKISVDFKEISTCKHTKGIFIADNDKGYREYFVFYVSNRGSAPVTILSGAVCTQTTKHFGLTRESRGGTGVAKCPISLKPGDTVTLEVDFEDVRPEAWPFRKYGRTANRVLSLRHSQSNKDFEYRFEATPNPCAPELTPESIAERRRAAVQVAVAET